MKELTIQTKYNDEPLTIRAQRVAPNVVTVIVQIGDPARFVNRQEHGDPNKKRLYGGASFCHPNDEFDMLEGTKQACRHALQIVQIGGWDWKPDAADRRRAIYSACRKAIAEYRIDLQTHNGITRTLAAVSAVIGVTKPCQCTDFTENGYPYDPDPHPLPHVRNRPRHPADRPRKRAGRNLSPRRG